MQDEYIIVDNMTTQQTRNISNVDLAKMAEAGLHFGHRVSAVHPKMKPYIFGVRNDIHLIDLEKTREKLEEALMFIKNIISEKKVLMVIGTKPPIKQIVKDFCKEFGLPYVTERWLGGTFTNFDTLKKRIEYFKEMVRKKGQGEFEKYTKKEKAKINLKIKDLAKKFEGLIGLDRLPDAVFVLDMKKDRLAVKEARIKEIKIVAIADTNVDPTLADYPIPANDDAVISVKYILDKTKEVIKGSNKK